MRYLTRTYHGAPGVRGHREWIGFEDLKESRAIRQAARAATASQPSQLRVSGIAGIAIAECGE